MKGFVLLLLLSIQLITFGQVFTADNCFIINKQGVKTNANNFNKEAFNAFLLKNKPSIEIYEQKLEGHVFINVVVKNNTIKETSLMYGISPLVDSGLVSFLKNAKTEWFSNEILDSNQRIVISIKVNYRYCTLNEVSQTNLAVFLNDNQLNTGIISHIKECFNQYDAQYYFDSTNYTYYRKGISSSTFKKAENDIKNNNWFKVDSKAAIILLDYDNNNVPNIIIQQNDSVYIIENKILLFNEHGQLKYIKRNKKNVTLELETTCTVCNKFNRTLAIYEYIEGGDLKNFSITSYSNFPQLLTNLIITKNIETSSLKTFIRSSPFKINEPFSKCTGVISEENSCVVSKTWGNIFGEIAQNTKLSVIQEYTDLYKKKWYFVIANRIDGLFLGWVCENDVIETKEK